MTVKRAPQIGAPPPSNVKRGPLRLRGFSLTFARILWVLITLSGIATFIAGAPLRYRDLLESCSGDACLHGQLTPAAVSAWQAAGYALEAYAAYQVALSAVVALVYIAVGSFIFWSQPADRVALVGSLWLVTLGPTMFENEVRALGAAYPALQPLVLVLIFLGGVVFLSLFLLIFPDGRLLPRWMRWVLLAEIGGFAVLFLTMEGPEEWPAWYQPLWALMVLGGIAAQIYRYRRISGAVERQQTKWVMAGLLAVVFAILLLFGSAIPGALARVPSELEEVATDLLNLTVTAVAFMTIPVALAFSILRYRLWDADVIINRTLVYGLLTAFLALFYFSSVLFFQQILQALTGQQSPLAIVASTLLVAFLFSPLRRRLQTLIDRRFYRRKYDTAQTLARFAGVARQEMELDRLTAELLSTVQQTMEPDHLSLWLKEEGRREEPTR